MEKVEINKNMKLSEHFTLGEMCKTKHVTADGNIPSRVHIENLKRICENWLEDLRYSYNMLYVWNVEVECGMRIVMWHCVLGSGPEVKCVLGSGPKVKSQATVLWRQTRGLRQSWGLRQLRGKRSRLLLIRGIGRRR